MSEVYDKLYFNKAVSVCIYIESIYILYVYILRVCLCVCVYTYIHCSVSSSQYLVGTSLEHWRKESGRTILMEREARESLSPGPPLLSLKLWLKKYGQ